ncbi:MAG: single-stranded DNA-binding protein [Thermoplasmatales archaeon]|nr:single-stranded DNA-binding protein [Thermoplasmatales archaeon]
MEKERTKIKDLRPDTKKTNVLAKVVSIGEPKEIPSRFGEAKKVAEAVIGDETGTILLSLWQEQIGTLKEEDVIAIENGFVSLVPRRKGKMHLNVGRYGTLTKSDENMDVNTDLNMSEKEYEGEPRRYERYDSERRYRR